MISVREVGKEFPGSNRSITALDAISFEVKRREFVSIVGPSGCGKTTLLRIIAGTVAATSGEVYIDKTHVTGPSSKVGTVFQAPVLLPWRTVLENVFLPADVRRADRAQYRDRARKMLATAGLGAFEAEYPWQLSGGMQQRAAICRALVYEPPVLLLDEPFGALDAMTREVMNAELMRLCDLSQPAAVLITHSIPEAVFLSNRVLVMSSRPGRVVGDIPISLKRPRTIDVMGTAEFAALTQEIRQLLSAYHGLDAH